jgi:hypothetical protein
MKTPRAARDMATQRFGAHTFTQNSLRNGLDVAEGSLAGASGDQSQ